MEQATLVAPDISCDHCIATIKHAVSALDGVSRVEGDPLTKRVTVEYEPASVALSAIEAAMEEEGYPVEK